MSGEEKKQQPVETITTRSESTKNAPKKTIYVRKLTSEELREKYVIVLRAELDKFPSIGKSFTIKCGDQNYRVSVEEVDVEAQGPVRTKYIIPAAKLFVTQNFKIGDRILLTQMAEKLYWLRLV